MKKFTKIFIAIIFIGQTIFAQTFPETFNYQAVARNNDGTPISNTQISIEVSIVQGNNCEPNPNLCNLIWQELHFPTTNEFGLFSINIGEGQNTFAGSQSNFTDIDWNDFASGNYFVNIRVDFGNSTYVNGLIDMGTVKLQSVPYSTTAKTAESLVKTTGKVDVNVSDLKDVTIIGLALNQVLAWDGTNWVNVDPAASVVLAVDDLSDVSITAAATNQAILYNGTNWANSVIQLNILGDVSTAALASGDILQYNGTNWANNTLALNDLNNVTGTPASGDLLQFDGANWSNNTLSINDLSDLNISTPTSGQALVFNGTNWVNQSVGSPWTNDGSYVYYNGALNVGIGTATPLEKFQLATTGNQGFLITGTYNASGSTPDYGAGTRMTFYPVFGAFRAGGVNGTQWDNSNMGKYSAAFGYNNIANNYSLVTGSNNIGGTNSAVFGGNNNVTGGFSLSSGANNTVSSSYSIIGGNTNSSIGDNSLTVGTGNNNNTTNSIVFGESSKTDGATGTGSISGGNTTNARGDYSQAFGVGNTAGAYASMVIGQYNTIGAYNSSTWVNTEPVFVIGNGSDAITRNNAFVIYKNGNISTEGVLSQSQVNPSKSSKTINYSDILNINTYSNTKNGKTFFGFSASEVAKYFPTLVIDFNNTKAIAYTQFIPLMVETIKVQQKTIDQLQSENDAMKQKLDEIEIRLQNLEKRK